MGTLLFLVSDQPNPNMGFATPLQRRGILRIGIGCFFSVLLNLVEYKEYFATAACALIYNK
jgi:hypothetical protein